MTAGPFKIAGVIAVTPETVHMLDDMAMMALCGRSDETAEQAELIEAACAWADTVVLADESKDPRHRAPVTASRRLKNAVHTFRASQGEPTP